MSKEIWFIIAALVNFLVFVIHLKAYRKNGNSSRKSWGSATIGVGLGLSLTYWPAWIYGVSKDFTALWMTLVIVGSGIAMCIINSASKNRSVQMKA